VEFVGTHTNIYLLGMPGSGKSTLGRQLSKELNISFYDLDHEIAHIAGKDITRIFKEDGESRFRLLETERLTLLSDQSHSKVIATGGGTPCFHNNMHFINEHGIGIFLDVAMEIIAVRLAKQGTELRPLLMDKTPQELLKQLKGHYLERKPYYLKAAIHIEGNGISTKDLLSELNSLRT